MSFNGITLKPLFFSYKNKKNWQINSTREKRGTAQLHLFWVVNKNWHKGSLRIPKSAGMIQKNGVAGVTVSGIELPSGKIGLKLQLEFFSLWSISLCCSLASWHFELSLIILKELLIMQGGILCWAFMRMTQHLGEWSFSPVSEASIPGKKQHEAVSSPEKYFITGQTW